MSEREYFELKNVLASTGMEGFSITEQTEKDCIRLICGEISIDDLVFEIIHRSSKAV